MQRYFEVLLVTLLALWLGSKLYEGADKDSFIVSLSTITKHIEPVYHVVEEVEVIQMVYKTATKKVHTPPVPEKK